MAILFCTCDGILNFQNIYYTYWSIPRRLKALQHQARQQQSHIQAAEATELEALLAPTSVNAKANGAMPASLSRSTSIDSSSSSSTTSNSSSSRFGTSPVNPHSPYSSTTALPAAHKLRSLSAGMGTTTDAS